MGPNHQGIFFALSDCETLPLNTNIEVQRQSFQGMDPRTHILNKLEREIDVFNSCHKHFLIMKHAIERNLELINLYQSVQVDPAIHLKPARFSHCILNPPNTKSNSHWQRPGPRWATAQRNCRAKQYSNHFRKDKSKASL
jgi:hypothetical protein